MGCRLEWALSALYTALQWPPSGPLPGRRQIPQRFDERPVGFEQILTVGDRAARKFPAPGQVLARRSLRDEHAPALIVERRRHHQDRRAAHQLRGARIRARLAEVRELAVTVLVLLARAARARLVASHFPLVAHEGR